MGDISRGGGERGSSPGRGVAVGCTNRGDRFD